MPSKALARRKGAFASRVRSEASLMRPENIKGSQITVNHLASAKIAECPRICICLFKASPGALYYTF